MHHFFAYMSRMKHIQRWGLMRNTSSENDLEHAAQAAMITHALCEIHNRRFGGQADCGKLVMMALYHDAGEVITGDVATPIKHFSPEISAAMGRMESMARGMLLDMLPKDLQEAFAPYLQENMTPEEKKILKAADKLCAYCKCLEELKAGNGEFSKAKQAVEDGITALCLPAADAFLQEFAASFSLTLDELN